MIPYTAVIATFERPSQLRDTLETLSAQSHRAAAVAVVDASGSSASRQVCGSFEGRLPLAWRAAERPSAAAQRNQGARDVATPLVAFLDDDVFLPPETMATLCAVFEGDRERRVGGVAARIVGLEHPVPRGPVRAYYRFQAGYGHPTYGGKLFGPAINCLPSYTEPERPLIPADWLNSTCVVYRADVFAREQFPLFEGYSFMEDVHLSARVAKTHQLFFHADAPYEHRGAPSDFKRDRRRLARMAVANRRRVAREVMGLGGAGFAFRFFLHRVFSTLGILRAGRPGRWEEIIGTWT